MYMYTVCYMETRYQKAKGKDKHDRNYFQKINSRAIWKPCCMPVEIMFRLCNTLLLSFTFQYQVGDAQDCWNWPKLMIQKYMQLLSC